VRFLTCPFLRVLRSVPPGARVLDVGAGHGVFSVLAANRRARVVAVEPDVRKVLGVPPHPPSAPSPPPPRGRRALDSGASRDLPTETLLPRAGEGARSADEGAASRVQFVIGYDDVVRGTFDVVAINDVLYKLPFEQWDALLTRILERLPSGGMLLVKEHDPTARIKNTWNRWQESLAAKLHLTLGESFSYETPADFIARLRRLGFTDVQAKRIDFGYPHPHILYIARLI
jgi:SAM-dependent methyltransferase